MLSLLFSLIVKCVCVSQQALQSFLTASIWWAGMSEGSKRHILTGTPWNSTHTAIFSHPWHGLWCLCLQTTWLKHFLLLPSTQYSAQYCEFAAEILAESLSPETCPPTLDWLWSSLSSLSSDKISVFSPSWPVSHGRALQTKCNLLQKIPGLQVKLILVLWFWWP